ncbi:bifunctional hydroxymethylpyrimidine kinase/phosphomethylpyrimidine kinase [Salinicoccus halodurans]|uniref:Hydroxymethylpyrimidine/phosphomethylpyrimidine kinase n=1 Tax=Salinicoccus halodurans TaxID=407035 RepID=A0A0F7HML4_9STAP|nr:bifunctional hydroxymethylpyrimidine kinase/phosphomethylpyrimidine kinase [Salinicoccus halodurans]AKG74778.1 phosphomethylpyrimidine kinase [Salinicoccus halodurans]SFK70428.1 hydroxymethylpyrimidine/phosphomethylpyrimidine kinase [Salinicoccus halodurans]
MRKFPIALTVAGTDPTGGAGVLADSKAFHSRGVYGMAAVTSLTAQNTRGVQDVYNIPAEFLERQLHSIFSDEVPHAMKSGMIATVEMMEVIMETVEKYDIPYVIDPVMIATSGDALIEERSIEFLRDSLLPVAMNVTPNIHEAEKITGQEIRGEADVRKAAKIFLKELGLQSVIIKGGHLDGDAVDYLFTGDDEVAVGESRIDTKHTHGTGCTFSAVITAELAKGKTMEESFRTAKKYITSAIKNSPGIGKGNGPVNHFSFKGE